MGKRQAKNVGVTEGPESKGELDIRTAQVISTVDTQKTGNMSCLIYNIPGPTPVTYVSPYGAGKTGGGMWAIPGELTQILVMKVFGQKNTWFYVGSIMGSTIGDALSQDKLAFPEDPTALNAGTIKEGKTIAKNKKGTAVRRTLFRRRNRPMQTAIATPKGHKIILSDQYDKKNYNSYIKLQSSQGKKIILDDSPDKNHIKIVNDHKDYVRLSTSYAPPEQQSRSFTVNTKGSHGYISREGTIKVKVIDGGNINIVNNATSSKRQKSDGTDNATWGKINLRSRTNHIQLHCLDGAGAPTAGTPSIILSTDGTNSTITINSAGSINIKAAKGINFEAGESISMKAGGDIQLTGSKIKLN